MHVCWATKHRTLLLLDPATIMTIAPRESPNERRQANVGRCYLLMKTKSHETTKKEMSSIRAHDMFDRSGMFGTSSYAKRSKIKLARSESAGRGQLTQ